MQAFLYVVRAVRGQPILGLRATNAYIFIYTNIIYTETKTFSFRSACTDFDARMTINEQLSALFNLYKKNQN